VFVSLRQAATGADRPSVRAGNRSALRDKLAVVSGDGSGGSSTRWSLGGEDLKNAMNERGLKRELR